MIRSIIIASLLAIALALPAQAGKVVRPSGERYAKKADLLFTVTVMSKASTAGQCDVTDHFQLKAGTVHGGTFQEAPLDYSIWRPSLFGKDGPKPDCPRSISYIEPPSASRLEQGSSVIATATFDAVKRRYTVTATFDETQLKQLKKWFSKGEKRRH